MIQSFYCIQSLSRWSNQWNSVAKAFSRTLGFDRKTSCLAFSISQMVTCRPIIATARRIVVTLRIRSAKMNRTNEDGSSKRTRNDTFAIFVTPNVIWFDRSIGTETQNRIGKAWTSLLDCFLRLANGRERGTVQTHLVNRFLLAIEFPFTSTGRMNRSAVPTSDDMTLENRFFIDRFFLLVIQVFRKSQFDHHVQQHSLGKGHVQRRQIGTVQNERIDIRMPGAHRTVQRWNQSTWNRAVIRRSSSSMLLPGYLSNVHRELIFSRDPSLLWEYVRWTRWSLRNIR